MRKKINTFISVVICILLNLKIDVIFFILYEERSIKKVRKTDFCY